MMLHVKASDSSALQAAFDTDLTTYSLDLYIMHTVSHVCFDTE